MQLGEVVVHEAIMWLFVFLVVLALLVMVWKILRP
jgi:hypothetical protein